MKYSSPIFKFSASLIIAGSLIGSAHGATAIIEFDSALPNLADGFTNGDSITQNGITLTFSNIVTSDGNSSGVVEETGLLISSSTDPMNNDVISFDITFNQRVQITDYEIGGREDVPMGSFFTLSGANGTSGNNDIPFIAGSTTTGIQLTFDAGTIPFFEANQAYSFTHNLPSVGDPLFNLESFSVQSVPEPSATMLFGLSGIALLLRRKK